MESINRVTQSSTSITDPDTIEKGAAAQLPGGAGQVPARQEGKDANLVEKFVEHVTHQPAQPTSEERMCREPAMTAGALAFTGKAPKKLDTDSTQKKEEPAATHKAHAKQLHKSHRDNSRKFPVSQDGTPIFNQSDSAWAGKFLGNGPSPTKFSSEGCAVTSMAMILSKLTGKTLTPAMLDNYLDKHEGYCKDKETKQETNGINWGKAGNAVEPPITVERKRQWDLKAIDASLDAGRPVALGVDFQKDAKVDHWICLTGRDGNGTYFANDPAGGKEIILKLDENGRLVELQNKDDKDVYGVRKPYKSTGDFVIAKPQVTT